MFINDYIFIYSLSEYFGKEKERAFTEKQVEYDADLIGEDENDRSDSDDSNNQPIMKLSANPKAIITMHLKQPNQMTPIYNEFNRSCKDMESEQTIRLYSYITLKETPI